MSMGNIDTLSTNVVTQLEEMAIRQDNMDQLVSRYCQERLLYRLSVSSYDDQFYLNGDLLLFALTNGLVKPSKEVTLTAQASVHQHDIVKQAFYEICSLAIPADGIEWDSQRIESSVSSDNIQLSIPATLGKMTVYIEVWITFKENMRITPKAINFPSLLDNKAAVVYTYPTEFVLAQKFIEIYQYPALEKTEKTINEVQQLLQTQTIEGRRLQAYIVDLFDRHHFTIELTSTLEMTGILKQFFIPIYEAILAEDEFFKQWNNRAWQ